MIPVTDESPCLVCGRPLTQKPGRKGRPREYHGSQPGEPPCNELWNAQSKLEAILSRYDFADMTESKRRMWRAQMWAWANYANGKTN